MTTVKYQIQRRQVGNQTPMYRVQYRWGVWPWRWLRFGGWDTPILDSYNEEDALKRLKAQITKWFKQHNVTTEWVLQGSFDA